MPDQHESKKNLSDESQASSCQRAETNDQRKETSDQRPISYSFNIGVKVHLSQRRIPILRRTFSIMGIAMARAFSPSPYFSNLASFGGWH